MIRMYFCDLKINRLYEKQKKLCEQVRKTSSQIKIGKIEKKIIKTRKKIGIVLNRRYELELSNKLKNI